MFSFFKRWRLSLAVVTITCLVTLALMEVGVRIWVHWFALPQDYFVITSDVPGAERGRYMPHPYLNYALRPGIVHAGGLDRHNAQGFRDRNDVPSPKPAGEFRIVVLGGSTTYGTGVFRWEESFPAQLQRVLRETYHLPQVRVVNMGVPGYNSWESLVLFAFKGLDLQPDLVIDDDGINDIHARFVRPDRYVGDDTGHRRQWTVDSTTLRMLDSPSYLVRFIAWRLMRIYPYDIDNIMWNPESPRRPIPDTVNPLLGLTPSQTLDANPPRYFARNLRSIAAMQRVNGGEILFLTVTSQPKAGPGTYIATAHYQRALAEQNDVVRNLARDIKAPLVDLAVLMKDSDPALWTSTGVHPNAQGNRRIAEILGAAIHEGVATMIARRNRAAVPTAK